MDSLYRNHFVAAVAGIFCLLGASVVSADVPNNAVGWFKFAPDVRTRFIQQEANIAQNRSDNAALQARIEELEALVATLQAGIVPNLATYLRIGTHNGQPAALFEAVNVMVINGTGSSVGDPNGLGNLIVGYDNFRGEADDDKGGSHNLVVGDRHNYSGNVGFVAGQANSILADYATVSGGVSNTVMGDGSSVTGGLNNTASGIGSSVSGGQNNTALQDGSSVSGGEGNVTSARFASVSGGRGNTAASSWSSVSGGRNNTAQEGFYSSVSGGNNNTAIGVSSSVSGGDNNLAAGNFSNVSGGLNRSAPADNDWVAGELFQDR